MSDWFQMYIACMMNGLDVLILLRMIVTPWAKAWVDYDAAEIYVITLKILVGAYVYVKLRL